MRVRITKLPKPGEFDEFDLTRLEEGGACEVSARLGMLLVVAGYAEIMPSRFEHWEAADSPPRPKKRSDS